MIPLVYYISGHGYGHAVRSREVISSLKRACPEAAWHVRTSAPQWLFEELSFPISHHSQVLDVGVVQSDSLQMDLDATLRACQELHDKFPGLVEEEIAFIRAHGIRCIVGDIPPLCFEIAHRCSLPSVAITNFTWDWIYRDYVGEFPAFLPLAQEMESFYRKATLGLCLPFSCHPEIFPNRASLPMIARVSSLDKSEARKRFGLPATATVVLISFGGFGLRELPWEKLQHDGELFFVTTGVVPNGGKNLLVLPEAQSHYEDLVQAADVVVSKPGYGIVADVIAHRVPILYTTRGPFPEYRFLVETLTQWATGEFVPQTELLAGNLGPPLKRLLEKEPNWPDIPLNGAEIAAKKILSLLE